MAPKTFKEIYQSQSAQRKLDRELQKQKDREFAEKHPILTIVTSLLSLSLSGYFFYVVLNKPAPSRDVLNSQSDSRCQGIYPIGTTRYEDCVSHGRYINEWTSDK